MSRNGGGEGKERMREKGKKEGRKGTVGGRRGEEREPWFGSRKG